MTFDKIGSIQSVTDGGDPSIGKLSTASAESFECLGPFASALEYFIAITNEAMKRQDVSGGEADKTSVSLATLGVSVFLDVIENTNFFKSDAETQFALNHMDLGTQNILVDDDFNFVAIIDWEFAHVAPWQVHHYPMPFTITWPDEKIKAAVQDSSHIAHKNITQQEAGRRMYVQKFKDAEENLRKQGKLVAQSIADILDSPASRIYGIYCKLGDQPETNATLVSEMVRLAYGLDAEGTRMYLQEVQCRI